MQLALDIGNSATKGGLFDGERLYRTFRIATRPTDGASWQRALHSEVENLEIDRAGITCVVPTATEPVQAAVRETVGAGALVIRPSLHLPFEMAYETPETLGMDRLAAAAAAWVQHGRVKDNSSHSVVTLDAGTAITVDVTTHEGAYLGGSIAPGPLLQRQALTQGTAQLPSIPLQLPDTPVGSSTRTALQSGIMFGIIDSTQRMIQRVLATLEHPYVVATGGWSRFLTEHIPEIDRVAPDLVLYGIVHLMELNPERDR